MRPQLYKPLGFVFLALAAVGVVLPGLPTTPFLLLAAWFFARSSPKWHRWLLANPMFGPMISDWESQRCISARTKAVAVLSMLVVGAVSIAFAMEAMWLRLLTALLIGIGLAVVLRIRTCPRRDRAT